MPLSISRLRRWFAAGAIGLVLVVAAVYFYARHKVQNALKDVPGKIGIEVQQSAQGFTVSRSEQGHTLFKVQASKAVQFKQGGRAELHDVTITLYGRDSNRLTRFTVRISSTTRNPGTSSEKVKCRWIWKLIRRA
jgi:lipopolysaccharide export system protein LptA